MSTTTADTKADELRRIGASAYASIAEMVAALECDYDRLEELRDEQQAYSDSGDVNDPEHTAALERWAEENPEDAEELAELTDAAGECKDADDARQRIEEDALSVRIFGERTNGEWEADKFEILLATGGPAVRIMGELDANCEPSHAYLETQDWGTPWTEYYETGIRDTLLAYCRCFCFE